MDAVAVHFGKDRKGRVRGVCSTVSRTKMRATMTLCEELEVEKVSKLSTHDKINDMFEILKTLQANNTSSVPGNESRGSLTIQKNQNYLEKSHNAEAQARLLREREKCINLLKLDGSKVIATTIIVRTLL